LIKLIIDNKDNQMSIDYTIYSLDHLTDFDISKYN